MGHLPLGQISIKIHNRTYRLNCGDGDEPRLTELAAYVGEKAQALLDEHGRISDEHLMLMSAILVADELFDARASKPQQGQENQSQRSKAHPQQARLETKSARETEAAK